MLLLKIISISSSNTSCFVCSLISSILLISSSVISLINKIWKEVNGAGAMKGITGVAAMERVTEVGAGANCCKDRRTLQNSTRRKFREDLGTDGKPWCSDWIILL